MRLKKIVSAVCLCSMAAITCVLLPGCGGDRYRTDEGMVWHTAYHVAYRSERDMRDSIISTLDRVGASLNVFDPSSVASRANASDSVPVDADYIRVYEMSRHINQVSGGAFDPTLGPLITAWGFGKGHRATADTLRIDSLLALTGIAKSRIENGVLIKGNPHMEFNFSAIAKGYGCDQVAEMLERNGISDYLVEIGGEIRCAGISPSGGKWRVSIDRPVISDSINHDSQRIVEISGCGMATSGNYRNFHRDSSGVYGHTISAKSGRPARTDVLSATVIAPTAMEADALATSMMALGSADASVLARRLGYPVLLVLADSTAVEMNLSGAAVGAP